jgi:hypothetical protein
MITQDKEGVRTRGSHTLDFVANPLFFENCDPRHSGWFDYPLNATTASLSWTLNLQKLTDSGGILNPAAGCFMESGDFVAPLWHALSTE